VIGAPASFFGVVEPDDEPPDDDDPPEDDEPPDEDEPPDDEPLVEDEELEGKLASVDEHVHVPNVPSSRQICAPVVPSTHAHGACCPGTQRFAIDAAFEPPHALAARTPKNKKAEKRLRRSMRTRCQRPPRASIRSRMLD
jgi:hypothetical protein